VRSVVRVDRGAGWLPFASLTFEDWRDAARFLRVEHVPNGYKVRTRGRAAAEGEQSPGCAAAAAAAPLVITAPIPPAAAASPSLLLQLCSAPDLRLCRAQHPWHPP